MKIVNRATFLAMPEGTVFAKYEPCVFGELMIKGESLFNDFCYQQIVDAIECAGSGDFADKLFDAQEQGKSLTMDFYCQGRDGCFDDDQLFAVWELENVRGLIHRLTETLPSPSEGANDG